MTQQTVAWYSIILALETTGQVNALDIRELQNAFLTSNAKNKYENSLHIFLFWLSNKYYVRAKWKQNLEYVLCLYWELT